MIGQLSQVWSPLESSLSDDYEEDAEAESESFGDRLPKARLRWNGSDGTDPMAVDSGNRQCLRGDF